MARSRVRDTSALTMPETGHIGREGSHASRLDAGLIWGMDKEEK